MNLTKGDKILVAVLVVFSIFLAFYMSKVNAETEGKYVSIQINGEEINAIDFSDDIIGQTYTVETEYGRNVLEFGKDSIKMIEASCPDQLCIKQGTISHVGQLIVCLPNRLVVEIKTHDQNDNQLDGVAF